MGLRGAMRYLGAAVGQAALMGSIILIVLFLLVAVPAALLGLMVAGMIAAQNWRPIAIWLGFALVFAVNGAVLHVGHH